MTYNGAANWHTWTIESVCDNDLYYSKMEFLEGVSVPTYDITVEKVRAFIDGCDYPWDSDLSMMEVDWDEVVTSWLGEFTEGLDDAKQEAIKEYGSEEEFNKLPINERIMLIVEAFELQ